MRKRSRGTWTRCCWPAWKTVPGTGTPSGRRCASAAAPGSTCPPAPSTRHCGGSRQPASSTAPLPAHPGRAAAPGQRPGLLAGLRHRGHRAAGASAMTSPLITGYVAGLRRDLPARMADEAASGLLDTYEQHLAAGAGEHEAARDAVADFGDLATVVGEFTRQAPGRRAARLLLATGPVTGACWAAALLTSRAWTWPVPGAARLALGTVLLITALALLAAATSRHRYQRTRLALLAGPVLIALDATAVTVALTAAPAFTRALALAVAVSLTRVVVTARTLPRLAAR